MKVIIFDFDGTIADSFETVFTISNRLAAEFGYPLTRPEDVSQLKELSSREILKRSRVPVYRLPFLLRRFRHELNREVRQIQSFAGMQDVLHALKHQGHQLGIVTSNSKENVLAFLEAQSLVGLFDFIDSGLTLFGKGRIIQRLLRQHRIDPAIVLYVGDETRDIEAARRIHVRAVAVSWGFNSREALAAQKPDFLIDCPAQLLDVVA